MPRQRFFNLAPAARAELLAIATKHFASHGFEGASLNEILAEAGISKGGYYSGLVAAQTSHSRS